MEFYSLSQLNYRKRLASLAYKTLDVKQLDITKNTVPIVTGLEILIVQRNGDQQIYWGSERDGACPVDRNPQEQDDGGG